MVGHDAGTSGGPVSMCIRPRIPCRWVGRCGSGRDVDLEIRYPDVVLVHYMGVPRYDMEIRGCFGFVKGS